MLQYDKEFDFMIQKKLGTELSMAMNIQDFSSTTTVNKISVENCIYQKQNNKTNVVKEYFLTRIINYHDKEMLILNLFLYYTLEFMVGRANESIFDKMNGVCCKIIVQDSLS